MRISDWSSDVCSSDLVEGNRRQRGGHDAKVGGLADKRSQIRNGVQREDEIAKRPIDDALGPFGSVLVLYCVVQIKRLFQRAPAQRPGARPQLLPEAVWRIAGFVAGFFHGDWSPALLGQERFSVFWQSGRI